MRLWYKDGHKTHSPSRRTLSLRRNSKDSSSRRTMRLVSVFILVTDNHTNYKCLPKFLQTDDASLALSVQKDNASSSTARILEKEERRRKKAVAVCTILLYIKQREIYILPFY